MRCAECRHGQARLRGRTQWLHARLHRCLLQTGATCEASTGNVGNNRKATTAKRLGGPQVPADAAKGHRGSSGGLAQKHLNPQAHLAQPTPVPLGEGSLPQPSTIGRGSRLAEVGRTPPCCVPHTSFLELDVAVLCQVANQHLEGWPCPLRSCKRIRVIKQGSYALASWQLGIGCSQRGMLPQCIQSGHQRVALFTAFGLEHKVRNTICVMPHVLGQLQVKHANKRQYAGCAWFDSRVAVNRCTTLSVPWSGRCPPCRRWGASASRLPPALPARGAPLCASCPEAVRFTNSLPSSPPVPGGIPNGGVLGQDLLHQKKARKKHMQ